MANMIGGTESPTSIQWVVYEGVDMESDPVMYPTTRRDRLRWLHRINTVTERFIEQGLGTPEAALMINVVKQALQDLYPCAPFKECLVTEARDFLQQELLHPLELCGIETSWVKKELKIMKVYEDHPSGSYISIECPEED